MALSIPVRLARRRTIPGGVPVQAAAVRPSEQRPVGALTDGSVDGSRGAWCQRDQGGLVALPDDPDDPVSVGERQVAELCTTRFRHAQGVEREQAGQGVVVAAGQAGLNEERAELGPVESEPGGFLGDLRSADMHRRRVFEQLFLDAVAVEPGENDQLERDRGCGETSGFEVAGVQLHVWAADVGQWLKVVLFAPVEPET
jgi:hypothetical protein